MRIVSKILPIIFTLATTLPAQPLRPQTLTLDQVIDRFTSNERNLLELLKGYHPVAETYIQTYGPDQELGSAPKDDRYFLGKIDLSAGINNRSFVMPGGVAHRALQLFTRFFSETFLPRGFAQMILVEGVSFNRQTYDFDFIRREFLGNVRCLVFDVAPKQHLGAGRFIGRIWVEDRDYNIVRFNGTYTSAKLRPFWSQYFHFDSWRLHMGPGLWLPAYVYSEESEVATLASNGGQRFKAQTRLWGYDLRHAGGQEEFTDIVIDSPDVADKADAQELSPVQSQRAWEHQAEDNILQRLEKGGLLAPDGEVNKVLETVVNNLLVTNHIEVEPEVRCRVLLTLPLASFTIGHTVVLSRGLIDVLPDEASLAMMLAHELAHIVLGHRLDTKYAFNDRMLFGDEKTFKRVGLQHIRAEEDAADRKAIEMLANSPYKEKMGNAGLFLKMVAQRAPQLPSLIRSHLGDRIAEEGGVLRMSELMNIAPKLQMIKVDQIAALPLGSRIRLDPWSDQIELIKNKPVALLSAREKMPFEVTPFIIHLTRRKTTQSAAIGQAGTGTKPVASAAEQRSESGVDPR